MSTEERTKGRFSWVIPLLEFIVIIAYFAIGYGGLMNAFSHMDFAGMFESVRIAISFLIVAIALLTVLCFLPAFKSKGNVYWAIWNIIWIVFSIYSII